MKESFKSTEQNNVIVKHALDSLVYQLEQNYNWRAVNSNKEGQLKVILHNLMCLPFSV